MKIQPSTEESASGLPKKFRSICVVIHDNRVAVKPFVHALKVTFAVKGELEIIDVRPHEERIKNIGVRMYLEKWGLLHLDSTRNDVVTTGVRVKKVLKSGNNRKVVKSRLKRSPHDLLVVGTENHQSTAGLFSKSLAAYLADYFRQSTLFIPTTSRSIIDDETGNVLMQRVLMPIENMEFFTHAFATLCQFIALFPGLTVEVTLLHVGTAFPAIRPAPHAQIVWKECLQSGPVVETICTYSETIQADLIVMATNGRNTLPRKIVGSTTEKVLAQVYCPVLSIAIEGKQ